MSTEFTDLSTNPEGNDLSSYPATVYIQDDGIDHEGHLMVQLNPDPTQPGAMFLGIHEPDTDTTIGAGIERDVLLRLLRDLTNTLAKLKGPTE